MIVPLNDRHLCRLIEEDERKTRAGLIVPSTNKPKLKRATVVKTGPGMPLPGGGHLAPQVAAGDVVLTTPNAGFPVDIAGESYIVLSENEIIIAVRGEEAASGLDTPPDHASGALGSDLLTDEEIAHA